MSKDIATRLFKEPYRSAQDMIFDGVTVPDGAAVTSEAVLVGKTLAGLELDFLADAAVAGDITIAISGDDFTTSLVVFDNTVAAAADDVFARVILPNDLPSELKVRVTGSVGATGTFSAYPVYIAE